jgi:hypothetical protein
LIIIYAVLASYLFVLIGKLPGSIISYVGGATMHSGHDEFISALAPVLHHDDHEADILNARIGAAVAEHIEENDNNLSYSQQHSLQQVRQLASQQ